MSDSIIQLYPRPTREKPLQGLYLSHDLRQVGAASDGPFFYANFITSLDGRIAISDPSGKRLMVPRNTANERDWRLFQELAAQADLIISSGRYLRDWARGEAQEILQVDDPHFADLRAWRRERGLKPQADLAIISASLRFPIPDVLTAGGRKVIVFTLAGSDPERVAEIEAQAGQVIVAGENSVAGDVLFQRIAELAYETVYSAAGPKILHLLLAGGILNRLYLTFAHRILGGSPFAAVVEGPLLAPAVDFELHSLYLDPVGLGGLGQLFAAYERA